jgi:hypothetical protein
MSDDDFAPLTKRETIGIWAAWMSAVFLWILGAVTFVRWLLP